jgi:hypothetical protein
MNGAEGINHTFRLLYIINATNKKKKRKTSLSGEHGRKRLEGGMALLY